MAMTEESWSQYRAKVLSELSRLSTCYSTLLVDFQSMATRVAVLETRITILGSLSLLAPAIAVAIYFLVKK